GKPSSTQGGPQRTRGEGKATSSGLGGQGEPTTNGGFGPINGAPTASPLGNSVIDISGNTSGGKTGIMGNMGSAGNFSGMGNPGPAIAAGAGMGPDPRKRITVSQVTGVLRQAQTFQTKGRVNDAIGLFEQLLDSCFDRPDAR